MKRRHKRIVIVVAVIFIAWASYYFFLARDHFGNIDEFTMTNGQRARVEVSGSSRKFFGHPHVFSWGGGDRRVQLVAVIDGETSIWRGTDEIPFILNAMGGQLYLVLYRSNISLYSTNVSRVFEQDRYVPYVWRDDEWVQIPLAKFPMSITEENIGVGSDESQPTSLTKSFRFYLEEAKRYDLLDR